jgi:uncharacterized cupredoxin-like copper-binding protein/predicted secreted protein
MFRYVLPLCLALGALAAVACSSSGEGGRVVDVTQADDGCTPASIDATPGEKLNLKVTNTTGNTYEIEGIEGTQLEEVLVPEDRTREVGYAVPSEGGTFKIKCYVPGGVSTIMEVRAGGGTGASSTTGSTATGTAAAADASVSVGLTEYTISPDRTSVDAGTIKFDAANNSASMVHELAVLYVNEDGTFENMGEIEGIDPGSSGTVTINMAPGNYRLACLIAPGEAGSTTDHYKEGMHTDFTVK